MAAKLPKHRPFRLLPLKSNEDQRVQEEQNEQVIKNEKELIGRTKKVWQKCASNVKEIG